MEPNLKLMLTDHAALVTLIGDRMYLHRIPQQEPGGAHFLPCAVFQRISSSEDGTFCDRSDGLPLAQFQVDSYATDPDEAVVIGDAVRDAMLRFAGDADGVAVIRVTRASAFDGPPDLEPGLYRRIQTFNVWYQES